MCLKKINDDQKVKLIKRCTEKSYNCKCYSNTQKTLMSGTTIELVKKIN